MRAMGTRGASLVCAPNLPSSPLLLNLLLIAFASSYLVASFASPDGDALLKFKDSLTNADALGNWDPSTDPCTTNWTGVVCSKDHVFSLLLGNMNLAGQLDIDALVPLSQLRTLDFMNNKFEGPLPDFKKLVKLKALFLSNNQFSGVIPDTAFNGMNNLKRVYLSNNNFTGTIPSSLAALSKRVEVRLENNQFEGDIPEFRPQDLKMLHSSKIQLEGPIPPGLASMDMTAFAVQRVSKSPPAPAASGKTPATPAVTKDAKTPSKEADTKPKDADTKPKDADSKSKDADTKSKDGDSKSKDKDSKDGDSKSKDKDSKDGDSKSKDKDSKAKGAEKAAKAAGAAAKKGAAMKTIIIVLLVVVVIAIVGVFVFLYMKNKKKDMV